MARTPSSFLLEPRRSLAVLATGERDMKVQYIQVSIPAHATPRRGLTRSQLARVVEGSAQLLELMLAVSGFAEAVHSLGLSADEEVAARFESVQARARILIGRDPLEIVAASADWVDSLAAPPGDFPAEVQADWGTIFMALVQTVHGFVCAVPIETLSSLAVVSDQVEIGHRCRTAFEALLAFVRRNDPKVKASAMAAGLAYAEGRLSISEVAVVLGLSVPDAVVTLEEHGFHRPPDRIELTETEEAKLLAKIRRDRLARDGRPIVSRELVVRDVIATQRIEGIDARPWISS